MTLRGMLGGNVQHIQAQIDELLDREDGLIVLFDGRRMVSYWQGFEVSPCQLELLAVEIERAIRNVIGEQSCVVKRWVSVTRTGRQREEKLCFTPGT